MLVFSTLSFWLAEAGIKKSSIGMLSWVASAYAFKWAWAPLVDNLSIPLLTKKLGRRKSWMLVAQIGIVAGILGMATSDPTHSLIGLVAFALLLAFSSATQDIVIDAFRIDIGTDDIQAAMAASYLAGYRLAMIAAGAGSLGFAAWYQGDVTGYMPEAWAFAYAAMAMLMLPGMAIALFGPEPPSAKREKKKDDGNHKGARAFFAWIKRAFVEAILDLFKRFGWTALVLLVLISVYRITDIVLGVMANPFYVDIGFTKTDVAWVSKAFGVIMTLVGAAAGGILVKSKGVLTGMLVGAILAASTNLVFIVLSLTGPSIPWLVAVISIDNISGGIATSAFIAFLSVLTNREFSATQYAVFSSFMLLLPKFVAGFSGFAVEALDYTLFFAGCALIGIPAIVLILMLKRQNLPLFIQEKSND